MKILILINLRPMGEKKMNNPGKNLASLFGGLALMVLGVTLVFMNTSVRFSLFVIPVGGYAISSGLLIIPLLISIVMLTAMENKWPGGILFWFSLITILVSLILSVRLSLNNTNLFNLLIMFAPIVFGLGLVIKAFVSTGNKNKE